MAKIHERALRDGLKISVLAESGHYENLVGESTRTRALSFVGDPFQHFGREGRPLDTFSARYVSEEGSSGEKKSPVPLGREDGETEFVQLTADDVRLLQESDRVFERIAPTPYFFHEVSKACHVNAGKILGNSVRC